MSDWIKATVGQITKYQRAGGTPTVTNDQYYNGEIPFVTIEDITNSFRYLNQTKRHLSYKGLKNSAAWLLTEPHILYSMYATVGKPIINKVSCATNQAIIALEASDEIDQLYLYYQLLYIRPQVYKYTSQTTQSNLNAALVKKLVIFYPQNKNTQKKIANILTSIDNAIEKTEALIHKYQQIKSGLMHDLFTRGVTADGKLRPPREEAPELYKETSIGWIPKEWEISLCGNLFTIDNGITLGPHRRPNKNPHLYLRVANVFREKITLDDVAKLEASLEECCKYKLCKFDILLVEGHANRNEIGRCAMVHDDAEGMLFQNHLFRLKAFAIDPMFGLFLLNSHYARQYWERRCSTSSGLNTINRTMLNKMILCLPKVPEQISIVSKLNAIKKIIFSEEQVLKKYKYQKSGLMQDLLTGKVRVKVDQEEPAHV